MTDSKHCRVYSVPCPLHSYVVIKVEYKTEAINKPMEVFCIHLPHRKDRMENINKLRKNYPSLDIRIFEGIRDENGARGCLLSHQALIRMAKKEGRPYIWVIEDDCSFTLTNGAMATMARTITTYLNSPSVDIVNGCGNLGQYEITSIVPVNSMFFLTSPALSTTHCIFYSASSYDKMLELSDTTLLDGDKGTNSCNMAFTWPFLATQLPSFSDIEEKDVNYEHIMISMKFVKWTLAKAHFIDSK
jgi:hypothetical protein